MALPSFVGVPVPIDRAATRGRDFTFHVDEDAPFDFNVPDAAIHESIDIPSDSVVETHSPADVPTINFGPAVAAQVGAPTSGSTSFVVQPQVQGNWCWAAVSTSVAAFYGDASWTQCKVVNAEFGQAACCTQGGTVTCNQPWYLDKALTRVNCFVSSAAVPLPLAQVQSEIAAGHVPCLRIGWNGGGGHFMAIARWFLGTGGTVFVEVQDPIAGASQIPYQTLVSNYQNAGKWTHHYLTVAPPPAATGGSSGATQVH